MTRDYSSLLIRYLRFSLTNMKQKIPLFHNEEQILIKGTELLEQFSTESCPRTEYQELLKAYQKLLKQTKILVRMSDKQQNQLTTLTKNLQSSNLELQQKAEEVVRTSEKKLAQFLEAIPVGVFVIENNGYPYYANKKALDILGKSLLKTVDFVNFPEVYQAYKAGTEELYPVQDQPIVQALQGKFVSVDDIEIRQGDKTIPIEVWGTPIFNECGKIIYAIAVFQDIRDRKQAEQEKARFIEKLAKLNQAYQRFVPNNFLDLLDKKSILEIQLGDQVEKEMTVLFSDIRDFTALSENMSPQDNFEFINAYLGQMEPIIHDHRGIIDKYIGDAIMALFPSQANDALNCSIAMLNQLKRYNILLRSKGLGSLQIGVGLNTGPLMLGTVGGQNRMEGTVIADAVNLASRIEELTKSYNTPLLITEYTYQNLTNPSQYKLRFIDKVTVKGKRKSVTIYEVFDADNSQVIELKLATMKEFDEGFKYFQDRQFEEAIRLFSQVLAVNPEDRVAMVYFEHCEKILKMTMPKTPRILIVDDQLNNLKALAFFLIKHQFQVFTSNNAQTVLKTVQEINPHLILLDVMMPGMDGFEFCQLLKRIPELCTIPVIFMSALTEMRDKIRAFGVGAVDYITKPFQQEEVLMRIKTYLNIRLLQQHQEIKESDLKINNLALKEQIQESIRESFLR